MKTGDSVYRCRFLFKGNFSVVVDSSLLLSLLLNIDSSCSQLSALLQSRQPPAAQKEGCSIRFHRLPHPKKLKLRTSGMTNDYTISGKKKLSVYLTWLPPAVSLWPSSWLSCPECWPVELWPLTASPTRLQMVRQTDRVNLFCEDKHDAFQFKS